MSLAIVVSSESRGVSLFMILGSSEMKENNKDSVELSCGTYSTDSLEASEEGITKLPRVVLVPKE